MGRRRRNCWRWRGSGWEPQGNNRWNKCDWANRGNTRQTILHWLKRKLSLSNVPWESVVLHVPNVSNALDSFEVKFVCPCLGKTCINKLKATKYLSVQVPQDCSGKTDKYLYHNLPCLANMTPNLRSTKTLVWGLVNQSKLPPPPRAVLPYCGLQLAILNQSISCNLDSPWSMARVHPWKLQVSLGTSVGPSLIR